MPWLFKRSLLGYMLGNATDNERQDTIDALAAAILGMTGDTTITAVSVSPEINSELRLLR